jgi:hypothetical protein
VTDQEHHGKIPFLHRLQAGGVSAEGLLGALAARQALVRTMHCPPRDVLGERVSLEITDPQLVERGFDDEWDPVALYRQAGRFLGAPVVSTDGQVNVEVPQLVAHAARLRPAMRCQRSLTGGVAVEFVGDCCQRLRVACQDQQLGHRSRVRRSIRGPDVKPVPW